jgi:hypothetical protein
MPTARKPRALGVAAQIKPATGGGGDGGGTGAEVLLPEDCPTIPLGYLGQYFFVLDAYGQFHKLDADHFGRTRMLNICRPEWLWDHFPRRKRIVGRDGHEEWLTIGWKPEEFHAALESSCKRAGAFDPDEKLRGRGAYAGEGGQVILHLGDALWMSGHKQRLGCAGEYVYAATNALPGPAAKPVSTDPGRQLLHKVRDSWRFLRAIDPYFVVGMMGVVVLGGALPARPGAALTGERGTGKSELMLLMTAILGGWLSYSSDATEAGIRQTLGGDALGMLLDEQESVGDNSGFRRVQLYWRGSYGGGRTLRGGQNHVGSKFIARGTIIIAAINLPAMEAADRSRVIQIEMLPLGEVTGPRLIHDAMWPTEGAKLIRRLADEYPRLMREVLPGWRALLIENGWDSRGADTYGIVLACAWIMLRDDAPDQDSYELLRGDLDALAEAHKALELSTDQLVLALLLGHKVDFYRRGEIRTIGEWLAEACGWGRSDPADDSYPPPDSADETINRTEKEAQRAAERLDARKALAMLRRYGINVLAAPADEPHGHWRKGERLLAVANICPGLSEVFRGTPWGASITGQGGWHAALLRAPTASRWPYPVRFPWGPSRVVVMRLDVALAGVVGPDGADMADVWRTVPRAPDSVATELA